MESWAPPPQYTDYAQFLSNMIGGLPDRVRQAQFDQNALQQQQMQIAAQQRQVGQETAFANGLPMLPNGQVDWTAAAQTLAKNGGAAAALNLGPQILQQQQQQDAQKSSPLWGDRGSAFPPSAATGSPTRPPSSPTGAGSPAAGAAPAGGSGRSISDIVSSTLPGGSSQSQAVAGNLAKAVGVDPAAPLTDDQAQKVQRYLASYAQRKGVSAPAAGGGAFPLFAAAGAQYGISPDFLARTAQIESGGNPNARNPTSSAKGLFEFTDSTAKRYGLANPYDPVASTDAAARLAADNRDSLTRALGRAPTDAELYLAHQQGAGGAAKLLLNPDKKASDVVGMKAVISNGGRPDMTAGQFAKLWLDKYGSGGATLDGNMLAMRQPAQGVAMPAGVSGAPGAGAGFPQLAPPGPMQQPQPTQFQALAGGPGMSPTGGATLGGGAIQPQPLPQVAQAAPQPPQQSQTPQQQALTFQVPLPQGFTDPGKAVLAIDREIEKLSSSGNPYEKGKISALEDWRDRIVTGYSPVKASPMETILDPRNAKPIYQGAYASGQGTMSPAATDAAAENYFQTGKLPPGLGRGMQGSSNINAIIERATELHPNEPAENWPQRWQNFTTDAAGKKLLATRAASLTLAETEAKSLIPRVREASGKVNRSQYPSLNKIIEMVQEGSGDQDIVRLGIAAESLAQTYARVLSPTGAPTVADKENAHKILNQAWSQGQIEAALDQMDKEIASAKSALSDAREEIGGGRKSTAAQSEGGKSDAAGGKSDKDGWVTLPGGIRIREAQ